MDDEQIGRVGKALAHPVRVAIIRAVRAEPGLHPRGFSNAADGIPLSDASYHFKLLQKFGVLKLIDEVPRRGSMAHLYAIDEGPDAGAVLNALDALDHYGRNGAGKKARTRGTAPKVVQA